MPSPIEIPISLSVYTFPATRGSVRSIRYENRERIVRALKYGGGTWLGTILCVFIPVMHFVLVPVGLIAGPFVFFRFLRQKDLIIDGTGVCPKCQALVSVPSSALEFPLQISCGACGGLIVVEEV